MTTNRSAETSCPQCGRDNHCAIVAGKPVDQCWCGRQPVNAAAIANLPSQAIGTVCLCPDCARINGGSFLAR